MDTLLPNPTTLTNELSVEPATSPISSIPNEVLQMVFKEFYNLPESGGFDDFMLQRSRRKYRAVKLSHICHLFREVALDTPALWTQIELLSSEQIEMVRARLQRSQPLLLEISYDETAGHPYCDTYRPNLEEALLHSNRWGELDIFCEAGGEGDLRSGSAFYWHPPQPCVVSKKHQNRLQR